MGLLKILKEITAIQTPKDLTPPDPERDAELQRIKAATGLEKAMCEKILGLLPVFRDQGNEAGLKALDELAEDLTNRGGEYEVACLKRMCYFLSSEGFFSPAEAGIKAKGYALMLYDKIIR
ncbi:MAG: hypothetical protein MJ135_07540 [Oscillospiraceae bacterium]|nr:hypothetical protein [Oscillospiraceae bacterium]